MQSPVCGPFSNKKDVSPEKRCQVAIFDKTGKILVVLEKYPLRWGKWGLPKGKFKVGELSMGCIHREVCEEVGIHLWDNPHVFRKLTESNELVDYVVFFDELGKDIAIRIGEEEILKAAWVPIQKLRKDVKRDRLGYNWPLRSLLPNITDDLISWGKKKAKTLPRED